MSAAVFITIQPQQLSLVCEKHSQGLKACLWIKEASDRPLVHGPRCTGRNCEGRFGSQHVHYNKLHREQKRFNPDDLTPFLLNGSFVQTMCFQWFFRCHISLFE